MIWLIVAMAKTMLMMTALAMTMQNDGHEDVDDGGDDDDTGERSMTIVMMMRCVMMTK